MNEENLNKALLAMFGLSEDEYKDLIEESKRQYGWIENPANYPCLVKVEETLFLCSSIDEATSLLAQCAFTGVKMEIADETDLHLLVVKERLV